MRGPLIFEVPGVPIPQGSKRAYVRGGRVCLVESANAKTKRRRAGGLDRWRDAIGQSAIVAMNRDAAVLPSVQGSPPEGAVELLAEFVLPRPKAHYDSHGVIRARYHDEQHVTKPDLDKLVRALCDALKGIAWFDDSQVMSFAWTHKRYASQDGWTGVRVHVRTMPPIIGWVAGVPLQMTPALEEELALARRGDARPGGG